MGLRLNIVVGVRLHAGMNVYQENELIGRS